uniref:Vps16 C-terminal domain-containing protein n=1 Tax=Globisporangium ultimum (strain ATCC 200006 / CBS 805.95 / DAOM BR144) TaxID=431595 RepID=K3WGN8_GLOUD
MGNVWSLFQDDKQLFNKSTHLSYAGASAGESNHLHDGGYSSKFAFYQAMKQAVSRMQFAKASSSKAPGGSSGDMEKNDHAHVNFMLAHWPREMDVVYDCNEDFPFTVPIHSELTMGQVTESLMSESLLAQVTSHEEAVLKGLSENKLSSSEAIHNALRELGEKVRDRDTLLRIIAKYPRASRLYMHQQLHACSEVESAFRLYLLDRDYARAGLTVGKLAYGEQASLVKKTKRLQEMSTLLQHSLDQTSPCNDSNATKPGRSDRSAVEASRAKDSFNKVMTDEMVSLLAYQTNLQYELEVENLVGSSLIETLHKLFALYPTHATALVRAVDLAEEFEVHPRQFSWALLKVLAQTEQWQTLLIVTAGARPAIGYIPIIELLLDKDHADLAQDLLALIDAPQERLEIMALIAKHHASGGGSSEREISMPVTP